MAPWQDCAKLAFYIAKEMMLPHSGRGPSRSISNQDSFPQTILSTQFPSDDSRLCVKTTVIRANQDKARFISTHFNTIFTYGILMLSYCREITTGTVLFQK